MDQSADCAAHPQSVARFQCDGCHQLLCDACIEESHRLLLCRLCGERALPLAADAPATTAEGRVPARTAGAEGPYGIGQALLYPFRGSGTWLFIAALFTAAVVTFLKEFGF